LLIRKSGHGETVTSNYFWLRQKSQPGVMRCLEAENPYVAAMTKGLQPFAGMVTMRVGGGHCAAGLFT
jgi:oligopeptidase B